MCLVAGWWDVRLFAGLLTGGWLVISDFRGCLGVELFTCVNLGLVCVVNSVVDFDSLLLFDYCSFMQCLLAYLVVSVIGFVMLTWFAACLWIGAGAVVWLYCNLLLFVYWRLSG